MVNVQYIQSSSLVLTFPTPQGCEHFEYLSSYSRFSSITHGMIFITIFRNHWLLRTSLYTLTCDSVCSKSKVKDLTIFRNYCLLSTSLYTFTFDSLCSKSKDKELTKPILRWNSRFFLLPLEITRTSLYTFTYDSLCSKSKNKGLANLYWGLEILAIFHCHLRLHILACIHLPMNRFVLRAKIKG